MRLTRYEEYAQSKIFFLIVRTVATNDNFHSEFWSELLYKLEYNGNRSKESPKNRWMKFVCRRGMSRSRKLFHYYETFKLLLTRNLASTVVHRTWFIIQQLMQRIWFHPDCNPRVTRVIINDRRLSRITDLFADFYLLNLRSEQACILDSRDALNSTIVLYHFQL